jgi:para-nitrobenzyl esterase
MSIRDWKHTMQRAPWPLLLCAWAMGCSPSGASSADTTAVADAGPAGDAVAAADVEAPPTCPLVQTAGGPVLGAASGAGCSYLGIPYAAPPQGALRWKPPAPAATWTTPRPSAAASPCPQQSSLFGVASTTEDCLYVNVWVGANPGEPAPPSRPVMVFVHGGGFVWGLGSWPLYDGTKLANATGAVIVTLNYRLGPFGFLSSAALRAEDGAHPSAGNYGIEDQIAAFAWVKKNAAAFGGDASNVTIFGQSAGATSMLVHLTSPKSKGLFERVIVESAWTPYGSGTLPQATADQGGAALAQALGCTSASVLLSCLRGKSAADVLAAVPTKGGGLSAVGVDWLPVVDGFVLPDDPMQLFARGAFNKVPTVLGTNKNEGTLFVYFMTPPMDMNPPVDPASYEALEDSVSPGHGAAIVAEYPVSSFQGSYKAAAAEALGDGAFVCGTRRVARGLAAAGVATFRYDFTHAIDFAISGLGAFHASELPFVFGNPLLTTGLASDELPLSSAFTSYWGSMAAHGDPNGPDRFAWPTYSVPDETQLVLDLGISTESAFKKEKCDFWDSLGY